MSETSRSAGVATYLAAGIVFTLLLALGSWQMQRRTWKEALLSTIASRQAQPPATRFDPVALGCAPASGLDDPCDFKAIRLSGRMTDAPEVHIFISIPRQPNGLQGNGYWVFRAFTADGGARLWVNTGFIPADQKESSPPPPKAAVTIQGILRRAEPRGQFSGANDMKKNTFYVRDPAEFPPCDVTGPACDRVYYVDMTGPPPPSGLPHPMAGKLLIPNRHLEYALTWFGLAVTWLIVAGVAIRRRSMNND